MKLAIAVKEMTLRRVFAKDYLPPLGNWDAWWQRCGHSQILHDDDGQTDRTPHRLHQEAVDRHLERVRVDELAA